MSQPLSDPVMAEYITIMVINNKSSSKWLSKYLLNAYTLGTGVANSPRLLLGTGGLLRRRGNVGKKVLEYTKRVPKRPEVRMFSLFSVFLQRYGDGRRVTQHFTQMRNVPAYSQLGRLGYIKIPY